MSSGRKMASGQNIDSAMTPVADINNITFGETCTPCFLAAKC